MEKIGRFGKNNGNKRVALSGNSERITFSCRFCLLHLFIRAAAGKNGNNRYGRGDKPAGK
jgi:hypothetical protein